MSSVADSGGEQEISWRGCSMQEIYRNLNEYELQHTPPVKPTENHSVLYHFPIRNPNEPPKPLRGTLKWDAHHVRLPCSPKSQYPVLKGNGSVEIENRWQMIEKALLKPIRNSKDLETTILSYNSKYQNIWKFRALHKLFDEELEEDETNLFFQDLLPKMVRLALRLPELIQSSIPLLKQGQNRSVSLSQEQVACLLANAFLCTFPRRNTTKRKSEYSTFPDINFNRLYQSTGQQVLEKIKCICHYFRCVCRKVPLGVITMTRRSMSEHELPKWDDCDAPLGVTPLHITSCGTIEDQGRGLLQVDFANKYLGGGVLGGGCVQEEIRFVICPELIISKLFTEALRPNEALIMVGCEQFSKYSGYASTFAWNGNFEDCTPFDSSRRRQCHIVAIDALHFLQTAHQYREELMLRELNKAYVGFYHPLDTPAPGIASGNWGCGAFRGEATLKALLQLMACTVTKRPLVYFTFGDKQLLDAVHNIHTFFIENNVTVKELWAYLKKFRQYKLEPSDLYNFICQIHCDEQRKEGNTCTNSVYLRKSVIPKTITNANLVNENEDEDAELKTVDYIKTFKENSNAEDEDMFAYLSLPESVLNCAADDKNEKGDQIILREERGQNNAENETLKSELDLPFSSSSNASVIIVEYEKNENKSKGTRITKEPLNDNTEKKSPQSMKSNIPSTSSDEKQQTETPKKLGTRQRTLVEMLDSFYKETPAPKRYCKN